MIKKIFFAAVAVSLLIGTVVFIKLGQFGAMGKAAEEMSFPPATVTAFTIRNEQWEQFITTTASVSAVQGVVVSAERDGRITEINFESDTNVEAGQVLVQLDTSSEDAQLVSTKATATQAKADLKRLRALVAKKLVSDDATDQAVTEVKRTKAQVNVISSSIDKKTIRAPFSGRVGIRQVDQGQVVSSGDPIVSLQMLNRVYIDFSVPQQNLSRLKKGMKLRVKSDASPGIVFNGKVTAIDLEVDVITRNVRVRGLVENPDEKLRTGMFVNAELILPITKEVISIPATAVLYAPFGNSVFVIDEKKDAKTGEIKKLLRQQFVILGQKRGDFVDATDGLKKGEIIVSSGVFKLRTGTAVVIDNTLAPKPVLDPTPKDS